MNKKFTFLKVVGVFLMGMFLSFSGFAQVTTSAITGFVVDEAKESMPGAVITATHLPSGTVYRTASRTDGSFTLPGLRTGGPYELKVEFVGSKPTTLNDIYLELGTPFSVNVVLREDNTLLDEVVVTAASRTATDKNGVSTVFNNRVLTSMPTISRSISDFTRLTPQANGNSFGGRDGRLNNLTVDGANLNNNFGLSSDPMPGGGNTPVSLDAFEEVSVNISPYDVKQGNFTGGNIAAITKSGTNEYKGTVYTYFRDNLKHIGYKALGEDINKPGGAEKTTIYGGSIGGPIIKNKLFFFVNAEFENKPPAGGITWVPTGGSGGGNVSSVTVGDLQRVSDYVKGLGYDPGVFDNFPAFKNEARKFLGKLDWNVSTKHKLTLKYSDFLGTQDNLPSQSANIGGTLSTSPTGSISYGPKFSQTAMAFSGTMYSMREIVKSGALELNSIFNSRLSNQFLATLTKITSDKPVRVACSLLWIS
ncbi:MAG: carboxypeptidase-like regulatory domain-containing protein [Leadbetterella sp.]|nr:carboxypeptidase-like regulatory domain-containing protein [Leadbetterella sp.]